MHSWVKQYNKRDAHFLLPQLLHGGICITILLHHLDHSHLKVLLSDVHSSLTNGIHTSFTAHSLDHKRLFRSHTLQSAPEQPASEAAIFFILMPLIKFIFRLWICKIARRPYTIFIKKTVKYSFIGIGEFNFSINTSRSKKSRIQNINSIGGHNNFNFIGRFETIQLQLIRTEQCRIPDWATLTWFFALHYHYSHHRYGFHQYYRFHP